MENFWKGVVGQKPYVMLVWPPPVQQTPFWRCTWPKQSTAISIVSLLALTKLKRDAWISESPGKFFESWWADMIKNYLTFQYWNIVLEFERMVMIFVRAHQVQYFDLYVEVLQALAPLFFSLDRTNYARWIPVHIRDMKALPGSLKKGLCSSLCLKHRRSFHACQ